jgi:flagellar biosynthesis/type III secretory pathway protein FliH
MRSPPVAQPGRSRRPFEFGVRFHAPLRGAELAPKGVSVAAPPPPPSQLAPPPSTLASPRGASHAAAPAPAAAQSFLATEAAREFLADREKIEATLEKLQATAAEFGANQMLRLREWQRAAVELAMTIASRLFHERVVSGEFPMEAKVRDMIGQLGEDAAVTVRLNPADLKLLETRLGGQPLTHAGEEPKFVPDETLGRGDCRIEGRESMLLSDVSQELQEIREELLRSLDHARS